jgi:cytoskeleton-associated protein 5
LDTFKFKHTPEDADALAADLMPASILTDLGDANWKTRLAALEEMTSWVESVVLDVDAVSAILSQVNGLRLLLTPNSCDV